MLGSSSGAVRKAEVNGRPVGTGRLDHAPKVMNASGKHPRRVENESPVCNGKYGRWVPGGDSGVMVEEIADQFIAGHYDYDTAVRLTNAITDAVGNPVVGKKDLLMVLMRKREAHHGR